MRELSSGAQPARCSQVACACVDAVGGEGMRTAMEAADSRAGALASKGCGSSRRAGASPASRAASGRRAAHLSRFLLDHDSSIEPTYTPSHNAQCIEHRSAHCVVVAGAGALTQKE